LQLIRYQLETGERLVGVNVASRMVLKLKDAINELKMTMEPADDDDADDTPPPGKMPISDSDYIRFRYIRLQVNTWMYHWALPDGGPLAP
jgi:hypothetical protein